MNDSRTRAMQLQFQYCDLSANRRSRAYQVARLACYIAAAFIIIGSLFLSVVQSQPTGQKRKVLILNSYHYGYDWSDTIMDAIQAEFEKSGLDVELAFQYMDTKRNKTDEAFPYLKELYQSKYHDVQFDVIISSDDNALFFLLKHRDFLFPGVPVVFCGVQQFKRLKLKGHSCITGVLEIYDYESTVRIAVKLHPSARQLVVIAEGGKAGFTRRTGLRDVTLKLDRQVELVVFSLAELTMGELLEKVEELGDESVVLFDSALTDREGNLYSLEDSVRMVREHCAAPIYITGLRRLGLGPIGGKLTNGYHQGQAATEMAIRILNGESADNIPILRESPNAYMFDYVQLKHFGISLSDLPEGSIIINEPQSFYYQYKKHIWAVIGLVTGLTAIIIILLANIFRRRRAEEALQRKTEQQKHLLTAAHNLTESLDIKDVLRRVGTGAKDILKAHACAIYILEADGKTLTPVVAIELPYEKEILSTPLNVDSSFTGKAVQAKKALIFNDAAVNSSGYHIPNTLANKDERIVVAPFIVEDEVLGAMCLSRTGDFFTEEDLSLVETFAIYASTALKNARLYDDLQRDISERKKAEEKLFAYQSELKSLTSRLTLTEERERRRIAMELHDRISQSLTISKLELDKLRSSAPAKRLATKLKGVCNSLGQAIADTRSLTFDLSSPILYELGFEAAVAGWLSEQIEKKHDITTNFKDDNQPKPLDDDVRVLLFRDVRELLMNVVKHANAKKIKVSMCRVGGDIEVRVEDDGWGFDPKEAVAKAVKTGGFGLFSIKERLEELGGHLEIESDAGCGTKVTLIAPLKQEKVDMGVKK